MATSGENFSKMIGITYQSPNNLVTNNGPHDSDFETSTILGYINQEACSPVEGATSIVNGLTSDPVSLCTLHVGYREMASKVAPLQVLVADNNLESFGTSEIKAFRVTVRTLLHDFLQGAHSAHGLNWFDTSEKPSGERKEVVQALPTQSFETSPSNLRFEDTGGVYDKNVINILRTQKKFAHPYSTGPILEVKRSHGKLNMWSSLFGPIKNTVRKEACYIRQLHSGTKVMFYVTSNEEICQYAENAVQSGVSTVMLGQTNVRKDADISQKLYSVTTSSTLGKNFTEMRNEESMAEVAYLATCARFLSGDKTAISDAYHIPFKYPLGTTQSITLEIPSTLDNFQHFSWERCE